MKTETQQTAAQHTAGPWRAEMFVDGGRTLPVIVSDVEGEDWIASLPFNASVPPNARLIAASPTMAKFIRDYQQARETGDYTKLDEDAVSILESL